MEITFFIKREPFTIEMSFSPSRKLETQGNHMREYKNKYNSWAWTTPYHLKAKGVFWHVRSLLKYPPAWIRRFSQNSKILFRCRDIQPWNFRNIRACAGNSNFKRALCKTTKTLIPFHKTAPETSNLAKLYNTTMPRAAQFAILEFLIPWSDIAQ